MDFTREPIIETIITPKEGYKLVVRSSKSAGQEEYFVDAVEVVAFGRAFFFRSAEKPKAFLVPISDYEVLEVREARMVLKNVGPDRSIKIGGGREGLKAPRDTERQEAPPRHREPEEAPEQSEQQQPAAAGEAGADGRLDKKRDRRRHYRKRRGSKDEEGTNEEGSATEPAAALPQLEDGQISIQQPEAGSETPQVPLSPSVLSSLLQPPPTLISETINRYRENAQFKSAFFMNEEEEYKPHDKVEELLKENDDEDFAPPLQEPTFEPLPEDAAEKNEEQTPRLFNASDEMIEEETIGLKNPEQEEEDLS